MAELTLIQIPFSHNCVKVRRALELKGLPFRMQDIQPMDRNPVQQASGQRGVPVLIDDGAAVADSTKILRHLEQRYPDPALLPRDPEAQAACWLLEDWADQALMALTRRLAYWSVLETPGLLEHLFLSETKGVKRALMGPIARRTVRKHFRMSERRHRKDALEIQLLGRLALDRLGGRPHLFKEGVSVADITIASMVMPLRLAHADVREAESVRPLIDWSATILGQPLAALYDVDKVMSEVGRAA